jgi:ABC-2 type transport system permease protein
LQDYVGEAKLNGAIRSFRDSFGLKETPPFPGSYDLYDFVKKAVPDSLHYYLDDSWLKISLYENRILSAKAKKTGGRPI